MSAVPKVLFPAFYVVSGAPGILYTSPVNGKGTYVDVATALNDAAVTEKLSLYIVHGLFAAEQARPKAKSITAGATDLLPEIRGVFLEPGDAIHGMSSTAATISLFMSGRELS